MPVVDLNRPYLTPGEIDQIISLAENPRDRLWLRWLQRTGIRITECLSLKAEDIDWERGMVNIIHEKVKVHLKCLRCGRLLAKGHEYCPKCGHQVEIERSEENLIKRRVIPVDKLTLEETEKYSGARPGLLFEITRVRCHQILRDLAQKAGLRYLLDFYNGKRTRLHAHHLRHSFAMHWIRRNGKSLDSLQSLQKHLGHQDIKTTQRYLHWLPSEMKEPYDRLWK